MSSRFYVVFVTYMSTCTSNTYAQVFSLLSVSSFIVIVTQLLGGVSSESVDVQQKTIEIFNSKLENGKLKLQREHVRMLLTTLKPCVLQVYHVYYCKST